MKSRNPLILTAAVFFMFTAVSCDQPTEPDQVDVSPSYSASGPSHGYEMVNLGTPVGYSDMASDINNRGQVVGERITDQGGQHAFLWEDGVWTNLHPSSRSYARGINEPGQVVGLYTTQTGRHAAMWDDGVLTDLGTLGGTYSEARDINNRGQVVGHSSIAGEPGGPDGPYHAFLWENGVLTDLGTLGGEESYATAINNRGQVVGWSTTEEGPFGGFLWEDGVMTPIGDWFYAYDINDKGQVVGYAGVHAYLWEKGVMTELGHPVGPYDRVQAQGINNRGQVVGWSRIGSTEGHAFLWKKGVMTDLGSLGNHDSFAYAINEPGQVVGWGDPDITIPDQYATLWTRKN